MATNLLELTNQFITPEVISKLSGLTGESETGTQASVSSILPVVIIGLIMKTATGKDASDIMKLVKNGGYDGGMLKTFNSSISNNPKLDIMIRGSSNSLNSFFGSKLKGLTKIISNENGISNTAASALMGFSGALIMNVTGKQILENNLNASALKGYLSEQENFLKGLINPDIAAYLGFNHEKSASLIYFDENGDEEDSGIKRSLPWIFLAVCAIVLFSLWRNCGTDNLPESKEPIGTGLEMYVCETDVSTF